MTSNDAVVRWTCDDVAQWLKNEGFGHLVKLLSEDHKIDGIALLLLTERDLRDAPLQIKTLGDVKRLWHRLHTLQSQNHTIIPISTSGALSSNGTTVQSDHIRFEHTTVHSAMRKSDSVHDRICNLVEGKDDPMKSLLKTGLAFLYCALSILITSFVMTIVHDRVPDMKTYPPLPDLVLDNLPLIPWAFEMCEFLACIMGAIWTIVVIFHKEKCVVLRRMFSLTGTVFLLRCVTMLITSLSVPGVHLECSGKVYGDFYHKARQALRIYSGFGMSLRGVRTCGDYMFSGHTVAITLLSHFITEYTPEDLNVLHTATWIMNMFGIFFILAAHEHYSIDVFVAFYISSRLFLYYHSLAYSAETVLRRDSRLRIWFPLFWFFESGGQVGRVPNEYGWPLPSLDAIKLFLFGKQTTNSHTTYIDDVTTGSQLPAEVQQQKKRKKHK